MKSDAFRELIRGGRSEQVPFWEVWFDMHEFLKREYGPPDRIESRIAMAQDLGMAALNVGHAPIADEGFSLRRESADGSSHYAGGSLRTLKQLENNPLPDLAAARERTMENTRKVREAGLAAVVYLPWCFHVVATSMGLAEFAYRVYDDFGFLQEAMAWVERRSRRAIREVVLPAEPDAVLFDGDCAYKNGLMVRPDDFRKLVFDESQATVALLREAGIPYIFHTDGKLDDVIPLLIELGFTAVHGCEKLANDLDHLVDAFGERICLIGNMDVDFLSRATASEVRAETERMIRSGRRKNRFMAACNTSPMDYIPPENYRAMAETIKRH